MEQSNPIIENTRDRSLTKLLNFLNTVAMVVTVSYIPFYYFVGNHYFVPIQTATALLISLIFYFVKRGWYVLSSYWLVLILTAAITWAAVVTPNVGVELLMIPICVVLITLFENKVHTIICFTIIFLNYLILEIFRGDFTGIVHYPEDLQKTVYYLNISVIFLVSFIDVRYYWLWSKETEHQLIREKEKNYELELEKKRKNLDAMQANNQMKVNFRNNIIDKLENITKSEDMSKELARVVMDLKNQMAVDEKIDFIQSKNEEVNVEFEERLQQAFPNLTKTEREICIYLKLKMSSKEIANLRGSTVNTINVTKNHIRKKLQLDKGTDLSLFLHSV